LPYHCASHAVNCITNGRSGHVRKFDDELAVDCYEAALKFGFKKAETALILKKMSEAFRRLGDTFRADSCLQEAVRLSPKRAGSGSLKKTAVNFVSCSFKL